MPLTVQPLNRRDFCRTVLGSSLAAVLWETSDNTWAEEIEYDHWVFLSDTHLPGDSAKEEHGYNPVKNFSAVREAILKLAHKPQGMIITGDVAYLQEKPEDYQQVIAQVTPYAENGIPVHIAFGNHDNLDNFFAAFSNLKKTASPVVNKHITILETPRVNLFILDSLYYTDVTSGFLGWEQLHWLQHELNVRKDTFCCLHITTWIIAQKH